MSLASSRPKFTRAHRERTVGSSVSGFELTRMNTVEGPGSSRLFSSASWESLFSRSASSMMMTRRRPSNGR